MPGIAGIIGGARLPERMSTLHQMLDCMMHEPYYNSGSYTNEELGLCLGWVNIGDSFSDCMPVWNEKKDVCLIFSGENYADPREILRLKAGGHSFDPQNASYLVHLYEETGLRFFETLNGRFSGMLVDLRMRKAVLFNDRYGVGRVYYHENDDGLYFSAEAKSLLNVLPGLRELDFRSLGESFSCGCVLQNRTLFKNVALLPGGSMWTCNETGKIVRETYFHHEMWENQVGLNGEDYYAKLKETFARIIPKYFEGKSLVGMSLTGGLDGRMIMAWAKKPSGSLPCYTFGSPYRDCADLRIARLVAKMCGQPHSTIPVNPQFFSEFPELAEKAVFVSDGSADVTNAVELYVNEKARKIAPVRLTGNYGQEILRGSVSFRPISLHDEFYAPDFAPLVEIGSKTYAIESECHKTSFIAFKQVPWHHYAKLSVEQAKLMPRSPFLDNELVSLAYQAPRDVLLGKGPVLRLISDGDANLSKVPTDRGLLYRPLPIITRLHQVYQEFTFKAEYAYDYGMPQWLARIDHALEWLSLEKLLLGRHKFYHFRVWYRDRLPRYVQEILLDPRTLARPYLNGRQLEYMVKSHVSGRGNYTSEITRVLTCELIHRKLLEQQ